MTNINDRKVKEYRKKKFLRYLYIILCFLTIILESLALFKMISYLWGLIPFIISYMIKYIFIKKESNKESKIEKNKDKLKNKKVIKK